MFEFYNNSCTLKNKDNHVVGEGTHNNWLYKLRCTTKLSKAVVETIQVAHFTKKKADRWICGIYGLVI
jgi:hypothetical protein